MRYVITGASAALAQLAMERLTEHVPPEQFTLISRNVQKSQKWADQGATVLQGTTSDRELLDRAFAGQDSLLLISGLDVGSRIAQHRNAIEAAKEAGIRHITYTSVAGIGQGNPTPSVKEHRETEIMLFSSGLSFAALRNAVYSELIIDTLRHGAKTGGWRNVGSTARIAPVSRDAIADCIATIMLHPESHDRVIYEISGPELLTNYDLAEIGSRLLGVDMSFTPASPEEMATRYERAGFPWQPDGNLPSPLCFGAEELIQQWIGNEMGFQSVLTEHVKILTGKTPRTFESIAREALEADQRDAG